MHAFHVNLLERLVQCPRAPPSRAGNTASVTCSSSSRCRGDTAGELVKPGLFHDPEGKGNGAQGQHYSSYASVLSYQPVSQLKSPHLHCPHQPVSRVDRCRELQAHGIRVTGEQLQR